MKKYLILILVFSLFSCSDSKTGDVGVVKETSQIISDYPDTLESTIKDAKAIKQQSDKNNATLENQLQNAKK